MSFRFHAFQASLFVASAAVILHGCAAPRPVREIKPSAMQTKPPTPGVVWIDELNLDAVEQGWGSPQAGKSVDGHPIMLGGQSYERGLGTHAASEITIELNRSALSFEAVVGVDDEVGPRGSVVFVVRVDGQEVRRSDVMRGGKGGVGISVELTGARQMTLIVENAGDDIDYDHADWADALIRLDPKSAARPVALAPDPGPEPTIAPFDPLEFGIFPPRVVGTTPGRPFVFRIPAGGREPLRFSATGLPRGLALDADNGILHGVVQEAGAHRVQLTLESRDRKVSSELKIIAGPHKLAQTPPMGWNSWNVWGTAVDENKVRAAAETMVRSGLAARGYSYINIDDAWEAGRDPQGRILTNEKFPDMKGLADDVHALGLKLGIYSSPGPKTCADYEGSYQHEFQDAARWAEWGIDLVKYDWCSYGRIATDRSRAELRKPYDLMRKALEACGRDIVFSMCQYGMGNVWEWGADAGGNYWRTTGDITDTWGSMSSIGFGQAGLEPYAGPGHWNDPDMLVVGYVGWGPKIRQTRLTPNEQVTHMTLWSLLASPLLIGCDMERLDDFTLALLGNPEVLEISQDALGRQAHRVWRVDWVEIWARPLEDGSLAVGLFNRGRGVTKVRVSWLELGVTGPQQVRDLWQRQHMGVFENGYETTVSGHGAALLRVAPAASK